MSDDIEQQVVERAAEMIREGMPVVEAVRRAINESPTRGMERLSLIRNTDKLRDRAAGLASGPKPG